MTHGGARPARRLDPLVGRTDELESFEQLLDALDHGEAIAVELLGEPGIGKTRLLAELAARAELRGHLVLSGSASELERDLPFSVFVHALDEYVETLDPAVLAGLDDDVQAELAHVLPSLSALRTGVPWRTSTSATGATAQCGSCSSSSHDRSRSCSCSTTFTGPTPRRSSCSARSCAGRRPRACCVALAGPPAPDAGAPRGRARAARNARRS